ncbi:MAG: response regulator [Methanotrichaceae archaeon]
MAKPYHILVIEDDPDDAELIRLGFEKHDEFFLDFTTTGEDGLKKMAETSYDLVSVDFALPGISGLDVLELVREFDRDIPVVMVTGRDTEDLQVVAFQKHATSYVAKSVDSFRSLPHIFEVIIKEARFNIEKSAIQKDEARAKAMIRCVLKNSPTGIYLLRDGRFRQANPKFKDIFGCGDEDLIDAPFWSVVSPENFKCDISEKNEDGISLQEFGVRRKDGSICWAEMLIIPVVYQDDKWILGYIIDVTEKKEDEDELLRHDRELTALHNIIMRAIAVAGDVDDLLDGALSDALIGLAGMEGGGIFLLEDGRPVLRSLRGPVEDLVRFMDRHPVEELLEDPQIHVADEEEEEEEEEEEGMRLWASAPIEYQNKTTGLLVVMGRRGYVKEDEFMALLKKLARQIGCMMEVSARLRSR